MSELEDYGPDERTSIRESFAPELQGNDEGPSTTSGRKCRSCLPKRYILAFMLFLGCCNLYAMRVNLSVAIVAMVSNYTIIVNGTKTTKSDFDWTPGMQGILLGAFFWGYTVSQIPGGLLSRYFGGKLIFCIGVLSTAVLTILTPSAAFLGGYPLLIVLRILEGLGEGLNYPSVQTIWCKWAPCLERSRLVTITLSGSYAGNVISMPLSGVIADHLGWKWVFYIFGTIALVWCAVWLWIAAECPADHQTISSAELKYITETCGYSEKAEVQPIPWKDMLRSLPFWSMGVAHFVENWGFYTLLTELPTFLKDALNFNLSEAGYLASLPFIAVVTSMHISGHLADLMISRGWMSTTNVRKLLNCGGFLGQVVFMLLVAHVMTRAAAIACLTLGAFIGGFVMAGYTVNALDIAPKFASIIWGVTNTLASTSGIIAPTAAGYLTMNKTVQEWRSVFYLTAAVYCFGAVFYGIFGSGEIQPWADVVRQTESIDVAPVDSKSKSDSTATCKSVPPLYIGSD